MLFAIPTIGENVNAPATQVPITIDGNTADWSKITSVPMTITGGTNANFVPSYKASWDKKNLYLLVEVQDSAKVNKGFFWDLDEVEVYLDMDNSKGTTGYDKKNDMQIRFVRDSVITSSCSTCNEGGTFPWLNSLRLPGYKYVTKEVTGGWLVEVSMPLDSLQRKSDTKIDFSNGGTIGFNIDVVNKNVLDANGGKAWALYPAAASWDKPNTWGSLTMTGTPAVGEVMARAAQAPIIIDGNTADWSSITKVPMTITGGTNADFIPSYKMSWDKKNLYMLVEVKDSAKVNKGFFWDLDEVELYLDMDNSKGTTGYDKKNDMQIRFLRDSVLMSSSPGGNNNEPGTFPWLNSLRLPGYKYVTKEVTGGWLVEVSMPLDSLQRKSDTKIDFSNGGTIGFNIDVVNKNVLDANGGKAWALYPAAASWDKPNTWGTLTMTGTPAVGEVMATAAQAPIIIDGNTADWTSITKVPMTITGGTNANFVPSYKTSWDKKNLYLLVEVQDSAKVNKGFFWDLDEVELYLDMDNSKGTEFDKKNDMQIRFLRDSVITSSCSTCNEGGSYPWTNSLLVPGMKYKSKEVTGGWLVEVAIPLDSLQRKSATKIDFSAGGTIGFNIDVVNKNVLDANGGKAWALYPAVGEWNKPNTWGNLVLTGMPAVGEVVAQAAQSPIIIDGNTADWTSITKVPMTITGGTNPDFVPSYKTSWDKKNLYLLVEVKDAEKVNKGFFWDLDEVELYLDMDNSKGTTGYDKKNDMQIRFVRDSVITSSCSTCNEGGSYPWTNSLLMPGMNYKTKEVAGGWLVEVALPLDSLQRKSTTKIDFSAGGTIGFNIDVVNRNVLDANGGKAWAMYPAVADWGNPSTWGNLVMTGTPADFTSTKTIIENKYSVYPNPVKDELFVNNAADVKNISIYSINGSMLNTYNNNAEMIFKLNTSSLKNGIYLLKLTSKDGSVNTVKLMKK